MRTRLALSHSRRPAQCRVRTALPQVAARRPAAAKASRAFAAAAAGPDLVTKKVYFDIEVPVMLFFKLFFIDRFFFGRRPPCCPP